MAVFQLITLLNAYLVPLIVGLSSAFSFIFYIKTKKKGFVFIGVAFAIQLAFNVYIETLFRFYAVVNPTSLTPNVELLSDVGFVFSLFTAILILVGLIVLFIEIKPKSASQTPQHSQNPMGTQT